MTILGHALRAPFDNAPMSRLASVGIALVSTSLVAAHVVSACSERSERKPAAAPAVTAPVIATVDLPKPLVSDAALPPSDPPPVKDGTRNLAFTHDGALLVVTDKRVLAYDASGGLHRAMIAKGLAAHVDPLSEGVVLEGEDAAVLLATPSLTELWKGKGRAIAPSAIATEDDPPAVVLQLDGKLVRYELPKAAVGRRIDSVDFTRSRRFVVVTWVGTEGDTAGAFSYEAATGARVGTASPMAKWGLSLSATLRGDLQYETTSGVLALRDLATGAVTRRSTVRCPNPKDMPMGNPLPSPDGSVVVVTCGDDGYVLEGGSFALRRKIPHVVPGCDNGGMLPAHYDAAKPGELVIEGCGGEARVSLTTGKYRCADSEGVAGAPYEMTPGPFGGGPPRAPSDRHGLPRCTKEDNYGSTMALGEHWRIAHEEDHAELRGPNGAVFRLPETNADENYVEVVADAGEKKVAYLIKDDIVVRSLPDGKLVSKLSPF